MQERRARVVVTPADEDAPRAGPQLVEALADEAPRHDPRAASAGGADDARDMPLLLKDRSARRPLGERTVEAGEGAVRAPGCHVERVVDRRWRAAERHQARDARLGLEQRQVGARSAGHYAPVQHANVRRQPELGRAPDRVRGREHKAVVRVYHHARALHEIVTDARLDADDREVHRVVRRGGDCQGGGDCRNDENAREHTDPAHVETLTGLTGVRRGSLSLRGPGLSP
jgi:hypothetical protein